MRIISSVTLPTLPVPSLDDEDLDLSLWAVDEVRFVKAVEGGGDNWAPTGNLVELLRVAISKSINTVDDIVDYSFQTNQEIDSVLEVIDNVKRKVLKAVTSHEDPFDIVDDVFSGEARNLSFSVLSLFSKALSNTVAKSVPPEYFVAALLGKSDLKNLIRQNFESYEVRGFINYKSGLDSEIKAVLKEVEVSSSNAYFSLSQNNLIASVEGFKVADLRLVPFVIGDWVGLSVVDGFGRILHTIKDVLFPVLIHALKEDNKFWQEIANCFDLTHAQTRALCKILAANPASAYKAKIRKTTTVYIHIESTQSIICINSAGQGVYYSDDESLEIIDRLEYLDKLDSDSIQSINNLVFLWAANKNE